MMSELNGETSTDLTRFASEAMKDLLAAFPATRLDRLQDAIVWTERMGSKQVQFEVQIMESNDAHLIISVSATEVVSDSASLGINGPSRSVVMRVRK